MSEDILEKAAATGSIVSGGIGGVTNPVAGDLGVVGSTTDDGGILSSLASSSNIFGNSKF
jgi:hypothetical protein